MVKNPLQRNDDSRTQKAKLVRRGLPFILSLALIWVGSSNELAAAAPVIKTPTIGWQGNYLVGRWTPVVVPVIVDAPTSVQLELLAVDSDGNRVGYLSPRQELIQGENRLTGMIKVGRLKGEIGIRIDGGTSEIRAIPGETKWLAEPLAPSARVILTVGNPRGFEFETESAKRGALTKILPIQPDQLPDNPLAFDGVYSVVVAGSQAVSPAQSNALRDWVAAGGRLVMSLPQDQSEAVRAVQPFSEWLPVQIGEKATTVREFGSLESFSGGNSKIPFNKTLLIPSLIHEAGEVLAASRSDVFLVRTPYAMGTVTILAMDLTSAPLSDWKSLPAFCERLVGLGSDVNIREKYASKGSQLSSTGVTDLATQLNAIQENFEMIFRMSPWMVIGCLLLLLVTVGPIDYLIVNRLLKRPHLTWFTFPLLITGSACLASYCANISNGSSRHVNQLEIVNVDVKTATARGRHFITLYSPSTSQTSVTVQPEPLVKTANAPSVARVSWHGVPESSFGGMMRPIGIENGAKYQQSSAGELNQVPVMQWSSKALVAESAQKVDGLVECNLRSSATGRLTGTISHHFSGPIEDWMVVYKNVVYRHLKEKNDVKSLPLPPGTSWRVEQPTNYSRELQPFLTGITTMSTTRFGSKATNEGGMQQSIYDSLSLDPNQVLRVMTFHNDIGGDRYTGLTNQLLEAEDLSHLHRMGRAILLGRLSQPLASIQQDQKTITPDRQTTFIRLILPVARSTEVIKGLQRLLPEN